MVIYAIDDEAALLKMLNRCIMEAVPDAELHSFSQATQLLETMKSGLTPPDVAFLDIELPGMGGIELAEQIKIRSPKTWIIFVTGFSQYAVKAYEMHARGYILKPVTTERIRCELEALYQVPPEIKSRSVIRAKCFGDFQVFADGKPLKFERSKTKELFAYLIGRNGAEVNTATLCAVLWEDKEDNETQRNYFRKLVTDLKKTLKSVGSDDVFIKNRNSFAVDTTKIDCDYYNFLNRDPNAINSYIGEYMAQYSWAEMTLGEIYKSEKV